MKTTSLVVAALVLFSSTLVAGCGGDAGSPKIKSFAASDNSIPEGGVDVTFTWDVKNAATLELLPFPGVVTGTSATVNVSESTTFTLIAKKKGRSDREKLDIVVGEAFDVTGHLVEPSGRPAAFLTVALRDRVTMSDENGLFTFEDVVAPYDLAVIRDNGGSSYAQVLLGITRPDPTITAQGFGLYDYAGNIDGTVSGGLGFPNTGETLIETAVENGYTAIDFLNQGGPATFDFGRSWDSTSSTNVAVNVVQRDTNGNFSHARLTGTLNDAATTTLNPALVDVPERTHSAMIDNAWGGSRYAYALYGFNEFNLPNPAQVDPQTALLTTAGLFTVKTPDTANVFVTLSAGAEDATGYSEVGIRNAEPGLLEIDVPEPVRMLSPVDAATVGPATQFAISAQPAMLNRFYFYTGAVFFAGGYSAYIEVYTDKESIAFPDLADIGLPLPPGTFFQWGVSSYGPYAGGIDDALGNPTGHWYTPDTYMESGNQSDRSFLTEGAPLGDDDDDGVVLSEADVRYEPVPEN